MCDELPPKLRAKLLDHAESVELTLQQWSMVHTGLKLLSDALHEEDKPELAEEADTCRNIVQATLVLCGKEFKAKTGGYS